MTPRRMLCSLALVLAVSVSADGQQSEEGLSPELAQRLGKMLDRDWQQRPQWADMLSDLLQGRGMQAGEGWFTPSESRFDWDSFSGHFDADENGRVSLEELPDLARRSLYLARLDRTRDGELSREDFVNRRPQPVSQLAGQLFLRWDTDSNGRISQTEFADFFESADPEGLGFFTPHDLELALLTAPAKPASSEADASPPPSLTGLLNMFLAGEFGSLQQGPALNDEAPGFQLSTFDGKRKIALSEYRDQKPVVLIFGSFT